MIIEREENSAEIGPIKADYGNPVTDVSVIFILLAGLLFFKGVLNKLW